MGDTCGKCGKDLIDVCPECGEPVETYSRPCGYLRPTICWNDGKRQEFKDRVNFTFTKDQIEKKDDESK